MRESSKLEKTKLPVDTYEGWLKDQTGRPERAVKSELPATDTYEAWIRKRVEKRAWETATKRKRDTS